MKWTTSGAQRLRAVSDRSFAARKKKKMTKINVGVSSSQQTIVVSGSRKSEGPHELKLQRLPKRMRSSRNITMSPPQKSQEGHAYYSAPEETLDMFSSCDQSAPYPLESTHLLQDVQDYGTEAIGIECEPDIKEVQQEEEEWCLADSIERVLFKDESLNSLNHETLCRQDHDNGILQERGLLRFQRKVQTEKIERCFEILNSIEYRSW
jgi:hypothetical protein